MAVRLANWLASVATQLAGSSTVAGDRVPILDGSTGELKYLDVSEIDSIPAVASGFVTPSDLAAHVSDATAAHAASAISFSPTGAIAATDVQAGLAEVDSEKAPKASPTFTGTVTLPTGLTGVVRADSGVVSIDSDVTDIVAAASDTAAGKVELAIASEVTTGTDTARAVTPDALAGSIFGQEALVVPVFGYNTTVTTGDRKVVFRLPDHLAGMNLIGVGVMVYAKSTSGNPTVSIERGRQSSATSAHTWVDMLSTSLTVDANDFDSKDAGTPAVINSSNDDIAVGDAISINVDTAGTGTAGLAVTLRFQLP